ncbi:putative insig domain containing protein [Naviculisporaceae sp. PSN 640]
MEPGPGQSPDQETPGPKIIRPIPRRPFSLALKSPTPPEDDSAPATPAPQGHQQPRITANDLRFLAIHNGGGFVSSDKDKDKDAHSASSSISRAASFMNLTSSTLFGIYSPTSPTEPERLGVFVGGDEATTPWGAGAETPARRRPGLDEETYRLMKSRSSGFASSGLAYRAPVAGKGTTGSMGIFSSLLVRGMLLFALGMGYGVLVTRLPTKARHHQHQGQLAGGQQDSVNWGYLAFWGCAGVALGCLLPWFDQIWEETFGKQTNNAAKAKEGPARAETDWALVIRGVGAFVGIVFAIRRLPWASTMQVSLTLALTNPFLWYLIDRSKPGFLLSAAVGIFGSLSVLLLGVGGFAGGVLPAPFSASGASSLGGAATGTQHLMDKTSGFGLGGLEVWFASQENIEAGVWILSVLFCSCVCFGNIGRRLALNRSAVARGRWGGVR